MGNSAIRRKRRLRETPTDVGNLTPGSSYGQVWDTHYDGLEISFANPVEKNGKRGSVGPLYILKCADCHTGHTVTNYWRNSVKVVASCLGVIPSNTGRWSGQPISWFPYDQEYVKTRSYFTAGLAKTRPGNPVASLGQFLAEIRDLPQVPFKKGWGQFRTLMKRTEGRTVHSLGRVLHETLSDFRGLGSEYLNVVFGWKPFVADLRSAYMLHQKIDKLMAQIVRENKRTIRRKANIYEFSDFTRDTDHHYPYAFANVNGAPPNWTEGNTYYTSSTRKHEKVWFVGNWRYYIPDTSSSMWNQRARLALFGVLPTPELLWETMPWSWLIDWFTNIGDFMSLASMNAVDNLVSEGAWVMRHTTREQIWTAAVSHTGEDTQPTGAYGAVWPAYGNTFVSRNYVETKCRQPGGNIGGLDVSVPDLSSGRAAILAALGINRMPR
jgi:hypothetical protein